MSLFGKPTPAPPPPPPTQLASPSIIESASAQRAAMAGAGGVGDGTDLTGGQGVKSISTTMQPMAGSPPMKSQLGA